MHNWEGRWNIHNRAWNHVWAAKRCLTPLWSPPWVQSANSSERHRGEERGRGGEPNGPSQGWCWGHSWDHRSYMRVSAEVWFMFWAWWKITQTWKVKLWLQASMLWKHYTKMLNVLQMWFCYIYWTSMLPSVFDYCSWSLSKTPLVVRRRTSWTSQTHHGANMQTYTTIQTHIHSSVKFIHFPHQNWHFVSRPRVFLWWRWGVPCLTSRDDIISINKDWFAVN